MPACIKANYPVTPIIIDRTDNACLLKANYSATPIIIDRKDIACLLKANYPAAPIIIYRTDIACLLKANYSATPIIIDCTGVIYRNTFFFRVQSQTYSSYKSHNTAKSLVGIAPSGI